MNNVRERSRSKENPLTEGDVLAWLNVLCRQRNVYTKWVQICDQKEIKERPAFEMRRLAYVDIISQIDSTSLKDIATLDKSNLSDTKALQYKYLAFCTDRDLQDLTRITESQESAPAPAAWQKANTSPKAESKSEDGPSLPKVLAAMQRLDDVELQSATKAIDLARKGSYDKNAVTLWAESLNPQIAVFSTLADICGQKNWGSKDHLALQVMRAWCRDHKQLIARSEKASDIACLDPRTFDFSRVLQKDFANTIKGDGIAMKSLLDAAEGRDNHASSTALSRSVSSLSSQASASTAAQITSASASSTEERSLPLQSRTLSQVSPQSQSDKPTPQLTR